MRKPAKKKNYTIVPFGVVIATLGFLAIFGMSSAPQADMRTMPVEAITIRSQNGTEHVFNVELATYPHQMEKGLMGRKEMADDAGMLFVFGNEANRTFWMKDTLIPLDMLFIARDGEIHHIHHLAKPLDESLITAERPAFAVLEINGGLSDKSGIKEGDMVIHEAFRNEGVAH